jgi:hypothetical protein
MVSNLILGGFIVVLIWLLLITFFTWRTSAHYNRLTKGISERSLKNVLEKLLRDVDFQKKETEQLKEFTVKLDKDGQLHIQKLGLIRFNPFKDTGGDQSFVLSLLDGSDTGVIISGLYSRAGTRWYAKKVLDGKGVEHDLSEEEKRSVKEAKVVGAK